MKNQYVGDINDFCKYGLLRGLARGSFATVCWMLTPDDGGDDGRRTGYLAEPAAWRWRDPQLFDLLHTLARNPSRRRVQAIERAGILPRARFHSAILEPAPADREVYFATLWKAARGSRLLFFDPDNGIEIPSCPYGRRGSQRYLYITELAAAYARGFSILVYQHFPRVARLPYVRKICATLHARMGVRPLYSFSTPQVVFFLLAQPGHVQFFEQRVSNMRSVWEDRIRIARQTQASR
ncbi:MAG: hypothetical protein V1774_09480 [Candidatus Eisenbacteria bacterium]